MSNPLNTNSFRHYLEFTNWAESVLYEITEPIGFDAFKFEKQQESRKYARTRIFGAYDNMELADIYSIKAVTPFAVNPYGDTSEHLEHGLQWLLYGLEKYGFQFKVKYHLEQNGIFFEPLILDFTEKTLTNKTDYVKVKLIQDNLVLDYKRQADTKLNLFADKNLKGDAITPLQTFNYLHVSTPKSAQSEWQLNNNVRLLWFTGNPFFFNPIQNLISYGVSNSLAFFDSVPSGDDTLLDSFGYVRAIKTLTNVNIRVRFSYKIITGGTLDLYFVRGFDNDTITQTEIVSLDDNTGMWHVYDFTINFPIINIGEKLSIYFRCPFFDIEFDPSFITIDVVETALNRVFKASRYIDLLKQTDKMINNVGVDAPLFDIGGIHYDLAVFCRRMVSNRTDFFYTSFKDATEGLMFANCENENYNDVIQVRHFDEFYDPIEIGVFTENPDRESLAYFNDRLQVNNAKYSYKKYAKDRVVTGTNKVIHGETEWNVPNPMSENKKEVSIGYVWDSYQHQDIVDLEIKEPTTETEDNDDICVVNIVPVAPTEFNLLYLYLAMRVNGLGQLEILNRNSLGEEIFLNWEQLGLGTTMQILEGQNIGTYSIVSFTSSLLTLSGGAPTFSGDGLVVMKYFYANVGFKSRTNQGFTTITGVSQNFSNLFYTPKRNLLNYFGTLLKSYLQYTQLDITNLQYKNNGEVVTQLTTDIAPITENAPILYDNLPTAKLSGWCYKNTCVAEYSEVVDFMTTYKTIKGYATIIGVDNKIKKVFVKDLAYLPASNELELDGEELFETEFLTITGTIGNLYVSGSPRRIDWWRFQNDFLQVFDEKSRPLSNKYEYNLVILNGVTYNSADELATALMLLN